MTKSYFLDAERCNRLQNDSVASRFPHVYTEIEHVSMVMDSIKTQRKIEEKVMTINRAGITIVKVPKYAAESTG